MSKKLIFTIAVVFAIFFSSCKGKDKVKVTADPASVYAEYRIEATEGNDNLSVIAQIREGDEFGDARLIAPTASINLDGEPLTADSAKFGGVFYEIFRPLADFSGNHKITFTDEKGKSYEEEFSFQPFALITELPETIGRGDLELELSGLSEEQIVRVILIDTAYRSEEINITDTVINGKLFIFAAQLSGLSNGPVQMELTKEMEKPLPEENGFGGKITLYQTLRREFILKND